MDYLVREVNVEESNDKKPVWSIGTLYGNSIYCQVDGECESGDIVRYKRLFPFDVVVTKNTDYLQFAGVIQCHVDPDHYTWVRMSSRP